MTPRSQGLKGNDNPCRLKCRWSRSVAERPEDEQTAEREGDGKEEGEKKREKLKEEREIRKQVAE